MRILIKGGVWKNTEDEILKAAVMKYGKCQWARVASLLTRKSAKQCKARWYEWLDPSIKKIEWSREEEEKLLHLAKLMPNQWRTVAPIVGRTAGQCMEHYEKLLDQAQEGMEEANDDPRRLRPGEIDPAPETKPARPDPIDMDEDEKEMLAEARARLANTKGKKAKRKARERQLEESRRLSSLQKRRELKAAGIESSLGGNKKRKYINYAKEIPFQKLVPAGFYDISEEVSQSAKVSVDPAIQGLELSKMEGRHEREEEDRERNKDKKRLKTLFKANAAQTVLRISEQNDPTALRRRLPLSLPAPQVSDLELQDIIKAGQQQQQQQQQLLMPPPGSAYLGNGTSSSSFAATQALVGDYSHQFAASATPLRTPIQENIVMQEARNLRLLRDMTPLSGEELPELSEGTGFEGATPRSSRLATPNTVLGTPSRGGSGYRETPLRTPGSVSSNFALTLAGGSSVSSLSGMSGRRMQAPVLLRDEFGLNDLHTDSFSVSGHSVADTPLSVSSVRDAASRDRVRVRELRAEMARQLGGLPAPEYEYEVAIPGDDKDGDADGEQQESEGSARWREDAADVAEERARQREEEERLHQARRSSVLKQSLPRPFLAAACIADLIRAPHHSKNNSNNECSEDALCVASRMIGEEALSLILHDNDVYPSETAGGAVRRGWAGKYVWEELTDDYLTQARALLLAETNTHALTHANNHISGSGVSDADGVSEVPNGPLSVDSFSSAWDTAHKGILFLPNRSAGAGAGKGCVGVPENKQELLSALAHQFAALRAKIEKDAKRSAKSEAKLSLLCTGYQNRSDGLQTMLCNQHEAFAQAQRQLICFQSLLATERRAVAHRVSSLGDEMHQAESLEEREQTRFATLQAALTAAL